MSIDNLALEVETQADRLFPKRTDVSMFLKIYAETAELIDAPDDEDEYADLMIMLLDYGSRKKFAIEAVIRRKMAINEKRKWNMNQYGAFQHVEEK